MNRYRLAPLLILAAALSTPGCGGGAEKAAGDVKAPGTSPGVNAAGPTPVAGTAAAPAGPAPPASTGAATPGPGMPPASESHGATPAKMPTPQIDSGGNDFFLFTQARAAVNADPELRAANLIIEVKEGVITLNGTVASAALKARAEELAGGAQPKAVRNRLRVSAGK